MKEYRFLFVRKDNAPSDVHSYMMDVRFMNMEQAKEAATAFMVMNSVSYKRIDIYEPWKSMWIESGEFVENTNAIR